MQEWRIELWFKPIYQRGHYFQAVCTFRADNRLDIPMLEQIQRKRTEFEREMVRMLSTDYTLTSHKLKMVRERK